MKKHLKYIDDTSNKFWQIEVVDTAYTVTYGKNGTNGVSQTKTFADQTECLKAAEKLLNEKIKKGYSESGDVVKSQTSRVGNTVTKDTDKILNVYDSIIKSRAFSQLLPFLKENSTGNIEVLKKHIKKSKKYWMTFIDFKDEPAFTRAGSSWGTRGDEKQKQIITASAVAIFNKTDILSWDEAFDFFSKIMEPPILEIIKWANPAWIADYLLEHTKKNEWRRFSYPTLRLLEHESLIVHHPELFAICIAGFNEYHGKLKTRDFIRNVVNDPLAYERDILELFNYETDLHIHHFRDDKDEPYNAYNTWEIIFKTLLQDGKINRNHFIEQAVLIQTKDWNSNLRSFFRKRLVDIQPTAEELIVHQENIFSCLHNAIPPVINFAIELIKKIYDHQKFNATSFLDWMEPVMMSNDNKAAIKNGLPILEKINKLYPKLNKKITNLVADVFVVPDMNLQERATKTLLKIASVKDKNLQEKLSGYTPLMQGNISSSLSDFLDKEIIHGSPEQAENYFFESKEEKVLTTPIELPKNWNDILYLFGKFIASDDVAHSEILVNAFIMQTSLFPVDYSVQLQPYKKQLDNKYFNNVFKAYVSVFLEQKIENYNTIYRVKNSQYHKIKTLLLGKEILEAADARMRSGLKSPLLSFPTHYPHWVAPKVLMERLIARQHHNETINKLDLSVAISRMPRKNIQEAIPLLDQLKGELKELMAFCLGTTTKISIKPSSLFNKLFTKISGPAPDDLSYTWAIAARTYYPNEVFKEFEQTQLKDLDFAVAPFRPKPRMEEKWNEFMNYVTKKKERTPSWYEFNFDFSAYKIVPSPYLFAQDLYGSKKGWEYQLNEGDVYYWNSLMPQHTDALSYFLLRGSCVNASGGSLELKGFLNVINAPGFRFSEITMLAFASIFFQEKKEIRIMAAEVLINLIEKRTIDVDLLAEKIAYLASNKYGVFSRLVESLATLKDISAIHNSAFLQLMERFFMHLHLADKLPLNFKRFVEHYVDLLYRTNQPPSPNTITFFEKHKDNASLKSLTKQILK
ncbi:WGR domain-containing protein [Pedobacter frigiditerrae]|uniref:WGR domain-containing protein n=1 Tax=Pedobacter frigiditerrae TaxID=2530452 RepID=A0A4R0MMQ2_9SPHI|nr:DUF6493 family protein [Pedobacter frigiditerrae]TCC87254.1 WGR domain-containing protein [Pedobacter frigiditerrae]